VPLNEECGLIEWIPNLVGLRPTLMNLYKEKGIAIPNKELKTMLCGERIALYAIYFYILRIIITRLIL